MLQFGEGNGIPLQYSCLENPMDGGAWKAAVCGVAEGRTWLRDFTFTFHFHALEKEMATHSSGLAWRIPGTGEPGGLPSMGSHRVGHDWSDLAAAAAAACFSFLTKTVEIHAFLSVSQAVVMRNSWSFHIRKTHRTSLEVQWLKLNASMAGGMGLIPAQGTKIPHATTQPK